MPRAQAGESTPTSTIDGDQVTIQAGSAGGSILIGEQDGLLTHNLFGQPGFASERDFDTDTAGEQTFPSTGAGTIVINGGLGDDDLRIGSSILLAATLNGMGGNDFLQGGGGGDSLDGGEGDDELRGGIGNDVLNGGPGMDTLVGEAGRDTLLGDADNDLLIVSAAQGDDIAFGGAGTDEVILDASESQVAVDVTMSSFVGQFGPGYRLQSASTVEAYQVERFQLLGSPGNDRVSIPGQLLPCSVSFNGGDGFDTLEISPQSGVPIMFDGGNPTGGGALAPGETGTGDRLIFNLSGMSVRLSPTVVMPASASSVTYAGLDEVVLQGAGDLLPVLEIQREGAAIKVRWPRAAEGFDLESTFNLSDTFSTHGNASSIEGSNQVLVESSGSELITVFRLHKVTP